MDPVSGRSLYGVLLSYAWQDGWCHPSQETLAGDAGCKDREIRNNLAELARKGLIQIVRQGLQKPNVYQILAPPVLRRVRKPLGPF